MPPIRRLVVGGLIAALGLAGCTEEAERIEMTRVPSPAGGIVDTIALAEGAEGPELIAPADDTLYVREMGSNTWSAREVHWPKEIGQTAASPVSGLFWSRDSFNFPTTHRLTTHNDRIWMLSRTSPDDSSELLVSDSRGRNWSRTDLPSPYRDHNTRTSGGRRGPKQLARIDARAPLRIVSRGQAGLYLLGANRVWKAIFSDDDPRELSTWEHVEISETDVFGSAAPTTFPNIVRNYLPATEDRPFDLLTVFGDRLYVYRRHQGNNRWVLVSTLPTIDIALRAAPNGTALYLFAPEAVYRSSQQGEQWEKLTVTSPLDSPPNHNGFAFLPTQNDGQRPGELPGLVVGTDSGAIYRSVDGGNSWKRTRAPDPDSRAITGIVADDGTGHLWASTAGQGILV
ncbi:MAG: WD40/YVTN/BNR-like repeat-containing protein, partial [Bradymonadaceae bacterium]